MTETPTAEHLRKLVQSGGFSDFGPAPAWAFAAEREGLVAIYSRAGGGTRVYVTEAGRAA